jgi:hypothetical protein
MSDRLETKHEMPQVANVCQEILTGHEIGTQSDVCVVFKRANVIVVGASGDIDFSELGGRIVTHINVHGQTRADQSDQQNAEQHSFHV